MSTKSKQQARGRVGFGTYLAAAFVATVWMMIVFLSGSRARAIGWPGSLADEGVLVLGGISASMLGLALMGVRWPHPREWDGE